MINRQRRGRTNDDVINRRYLSLYIKGLEEE
jgi:hypothetical protein